MGLQGLCQMQDLNIENLLWITGGWTLITGTYLLVYKILVKFFNQDQEQFKEEFGIRFWYSVFTLVAIWIVSSIPYSRFFKHYWENPDNYTSKIKWLDIFAPMAIAGVIGVFKAVRQHRHYVISRNKALNDLVSMVNEYELTNKQHN